MINAAFSLSSMKSFFVFNFCLCIVPLVTFDPNVDRLCKELIRLNHSLVTFELFVTL